MRVELMTLQPQCSILPAKLYTKSLTGLEPATCSLQNYCSTIELEGLQGDGIRTHAC